MREQLIMKPHKHLQICNIVRSPNLEPVPGFAADNNILRLPVGVVLVRSIDNVFPVVRIDYSRSILDFKHYIPIDRYKVELPGHPDTDGVRIIRNDIAWHRLAGMLKSVLRSRDHGHQVVAAEICRSSCDQCNGTFRIDNG